MSNDPAAPVVKTSSDLEFEGQLQDARRMVGQMCMALLASQSEAELVLEETLSRARLERSRCIATGLRAWLLTEARRNSARRLERRPARFGPTSELNGEMNAGLAGADPNALAARALLAELYPSEREAALLHVFGPLSGPELAFACGTDQESAEARLSRALVELGAALRRRRGERKRERPSESCAELDQQLSAVLQGRASDALYEHISGCEECRNARHDAERVLGFVACAGSDFDSATHEEPTSAAPAPASPQEVRTTEPIPPASPAPEVQGPTGEAQEVHAPDSSSPATPPARAKTQFKLERGWVLGGALAILGTVTLLKSLTGDAQPDAGVSRARVELVSSTGVKGGLAACAPSGSPCQMLEKGEQVPAGSRVKTDFATQATLEFENGARLAVDRGSELVLDSRDGGAELLRGTFVFTLAEREAPSKLLLSHGSLHAKRGKFAIRTGTEDTVVEVASGYAELRDRSGNEVTLRAGEQGRLGDGPPLAMAAPSLGPSLAWSERLRSESEEAPGPRGLGELAAKKPGSAREIDGAVTLATHKVRVRISGAVARTEIEEVFTNTTGDVLEGIYRFPLPPDAKIERLALEVEGKLMEGAFVDRDRASAIWRGAIVNSAPQARPAIREEIVWVPGPWKDPALLEWQRGGRFELRIFPIPKRGSRRIVLAYTEVVRTAGETRRYAYPLPHDPSGSTRVGRFELDVQVRGHDPGFGVRSSGYELASKAESDATSLVFSREDFVPSGDLSLEYALPERRAEVSAWAYRPNTAGDDSSPYVAFALRPKLPRSKEDLPRTFAITVDSSRSMYGESFARAKKIALKVLSEIDSQDRVVLLACDSECRTGPEGLMNAGPNADRVARRFFDSVTPDGASDPTRAQTSALHALGSLSGRDGRIVYIGDGAPTMGPISADAMEAEVARSLPKDRVQVTTVAVGTESDLESLAAVARGGGGIVIPYAAGQTVAEAAYEVLGAAYGRSLRNVRVHLPEGLSAVAPARIPSIGAGGETLVVARMRDEVVEGDLVIEGEFSGQAFERRYPVRVAATGAMGNAFVPRLYAALRIADLERDGSAESRSQALSLSRQFSVASRYTSLLVLESEAMFQAFGLPNQRHAPEWSGEEDVEASSAEAELAFTDEADSDSAGRGALQLGAAEGSSAKRAPRPAANTSGGWAPRDMAESKAEDPARSAPSRAAAPPRSMIAFDEPPMPSRRMVPMRRIWERVGTFTSSSSSPKKATPEAIAEAERQASADQDRRELTRKLHALLAAASDLDRAEQVIARWSERDPLDPEALTARADLAARRGERALAIRLLGSVVDVRPSDVGAQRRLERLHRWAGRAALGCRHLVAAAELRPTDAELVADAVRCSRSSGDTVSAERLLLRSTPENRRKAEVLLKAPPKDDSQQRGDVRIEATWSGSSDLDLALLDTDGARISWLGAPTRAVIMARDVTTRGREGLAVRGAMPGEYVIEVVRSDGDGPVTGEVTVTVAGLTRRIPFQLSGTRATIGVAGIRMQSRLVPL